MKRGFNKRGVSAVVATVLIIMITVAAVGIIWAAIIPMVKESFDSCKDSGISIASQGYTCYDSVNKMVAVQVKKSANEIEVTSLTFLLSSGGNSYPVEMNYSFLANQNSYKTFYLKASSLSSVDKIEVVPYVKNAKECGAVSLADLPNCDLSEAKTDGYLETPEEKQARCATYGNIGSCEIAKCNWYADGKCDGSLSCNSWYDGCTNSRPIPGCDFVGIYACKWQTGKVFVCSDFNSDGESECESHNGCEYNSQNNICETQSSFSCEDLDEYGCDYFSSYCSWVYQSEYCGGSLTYNCDSALTSGDCNSMNNGVNTNDKCDWIDNSHCGA